eukprot:c14948_g1_i1.p1 GENE.c14948_g1_i1~~c14948_g1_i1.p1  ORF type:complete len:381 (+),score=77.13 c14948_g1_i1:28-1170(+)
MEVEYCMVRPCLELMSQTHRSIERIVEKELEALVAKLNKLKSEFTSVEDLTQTMANLVTAAHRLKAELDNSHQALAAHITNMEARLDHLQALNSSLSQRISEFVQFSDERTNRLIVDFMLRRGCYETATRFCRESGLEKLVDVGIFVKAREIEDALENGSCAPAIRWCSENRTRLRKLKSDLEFRLRLTEFIELVQQGAKDARQYAQKHLAVTEEPYWSQVLEAMAILVYCNSPTSAVRAKLLPPSRWHDLKLLFRKWHHALYGLTPEPVLCITLHAGLIALKTPHCTDPSLQNPSCPVCNKYLNELAQTLPSTQHRSRLICRMSGDVMDHDNPPMALPNGHAYSSKALQSMADSNLGYVTCPVTHETYHIRELKKVFIT